MKVKLRFDEKQNGLIKIQLSSSFLCLFSHHFSSLLVIQYVKAFYIVFQFPFLSRPFLASKGIVKGDWIHRQTWQHIHQTIIISSHLTKIKQSFFYQESATKSIFTYPQNQTKKKKTHTHKNIMRFDKLESWLCLRNLRQGTPRSMVIAQRQPGGRNPLIKNSFSIEPFDQKPSGPAWFGIKRRGWVGRV